MEEDKDLFRKVLKREQFYLSKPYYNSNSGSYLYWGYYEKVSFVNNTHIWYSVHDKTKELTLIDDKEKINSLDELCFKALDEYTF